MKDFAVMTVSIGICVVLPIIIVFLTQRYKLNSEKNRKDIILAALEKNADINLEELVKKMNKPEKLIKEKLLRKLETGCQLTLIGLGLLTLDAVFAYSGDFTTKDYIVFGLCGAACLAMGMAYLITYFVGKKQLAKEIETEAENLKEN